MASFLRLLALISALIAVDAQQFSGNSNTRCYTCVSDARGYDYNYCRVLDGNQWNAPTSYYCPSGRCVKMDVVVRDEVYPRTYRFCDYDGLVTNIGGDQYSSQSGFDRIGQNTIQPNQCSNVEARTVINSLMNVASRVRNTSPATSAGSNQNNNNNNDYNNRNNNNNNNNNFDNSRQRDFANNNNYNNNNYNNNNNNRPYISGAASSYDPRSGTYNTQSYDSRYDTNSNSGVNRFNNNNNNNPNSFDNRNSFSGSSSSSTNSGVFDPSRNNYDNRYGSSNSNNQPGLYNNDPYRRNKRQVSSSSSSSSLPSNFVDTSRGGTAVTPVFTFDDLRLENVNGMRVCRCDYDLCNGASGRMTMSVVSGVVISLLTAVLSLYMTRV